ncbi:MAG: glycosyltransferase family 1 protein [Patescibacteria group bacterium]
MKIGILLHPYDEDKPAGLARTIFELTKGMLEVDDKNEYIIFTKNVPRKAPELPGKNWTLHPLGGGRFWLERLRRAPRADVYVFNTPVMPLFWRPPKSIVIALDFAYWYLASLTIPDQYRRFVTYLIHWISLKKADHIVTISSATKEDVVKLFKVPPEKISVVLCGFKKICAIPEKEIPLPEKFFFFAGILKLRKNILNIVKAFAEFQKSHPGYHLVLAGNPARGAYYDSVLRFIQEEHLESHIRFVSHLRDGELSYVYRRAEALVFPTFIEGFGYPVLEAMDCGIPVITSNQSSLKEIGGDAALLVNPHDPHDIAKAMGSIAETPGLRDILIKKGKARAEQFSWHKACRGMLRIIQEVF